MNAGGVLNTCKSNGVYTEGVFGQRKYKLSGGRVSNVWVTYPIQEDNSKKLLLKLHKITSSHEQVIKTLVV